MGENKFVLISTKSFPPVVGGSAFLLYELLRHFPSDYFSVIHGVNDPPGQETDLRLPFKRKQIKFINARNTPRAVRYIPYLYSKIIEYYLQREVNSGRVRKIYAHFPNGVFLVSAYKIAKKNKLPLIVYFDIYLNMIYYYLNELIFLVAMILVVFYLFKFMDIMVHLLVLEVILILEKNLFFN